MLIEPIWTRIVGKSNTNDRAPFPDGPKTLAVRTLVIIPKKIKTICPEKLVRLSFKNIIYLFIFGITAKTGTLRRRSISMGFFT